MQFENNFLVLNDRIIVDPKLAIFVSMGRMHEEEEGWQVLHISHDPGMNSGILTHAASWKEAEASRDFEMKANLAAPKFSNKEFSFFEFMLRKITDGDTIVWELFGPDEVYFQIDFGSEQRNNLYTCDDKRSLLLYIFKNLLLLPGLRSWGHWGYSKAQIRIPATKFSYLIGKEIEGQKEAIVWDERETDVVP